MTRHRRVRLLLRSALCAASWMTASTVHSQATRPGYGVTDLGSLGGSASVALAIADGGLPSIAGYAMTGTGEFHAFIGNPALIRDLGTLGGSRSEARATQSGWAAGVSEIGDGNTHAFLYRGYGSMIDLGTLGGSSSYANGIASTGTKILIVGASYTAGDVALRPFLSEGDSGILTELPVSLGGANATATAVNRSGHVVGHADLPGGAERHAFLYANGTTQDLGSFGYGSEASAISANDVVVGRAWGFDGVPNHAFRYEAGALEDLGTLGGRSSQATDVADDGTIVGWADDPEGARRAFIWRDGVMTDLNTLIPPQSGWVLAEATAINSRGGIVGLGYHHSDARAFLLTPPIDLRADLRVHDNNLDTNFPNPHEAGQPMTMGVTVYQNAPTVFAATGVTVVDTLTGPVEIESWGGDGMPSCVQNELQLTCTIRPVEFSRDLMIHVRATGPGVITHAATVTADQPDPNPANNSASQSNTAVSLASLTVADHVLVGGHSSLARATLTSPTPGGGATVHLTSSNPAVARVPAQFDVLPGCCDGGTWREFYVSTSAVAAPVTVDVSASYGLVTRSVQLTVVPGGTPFPYGGTPSSIPGTIQAEDYDVGGQDVAYRDLDSGNDGGAYRAEDVDIEPTADEGGGANVGWTGAGEWLAYTVDVASTGAYTVDARVASFGDAGTFHIEFDGIDTTGPITVPDTGGWQEWTTLTRTVSLDGGTHLMRVRFDATGANGTVGNLNYLRFTPASAPIPFGGTPRAIPGRIEAEEFDEGGEGVAYVDATPGNAGGAFRATDVDLEPTSDSGGGYNVGWIGAPEWLNYTVLVAEDGTYTITARVAAQGAGGTFHVEIDGVDVTGPLTIPDTGDWQAWTNVSAAVPLTGGLHALRFLADANGSTGVIGNLNYLDVVK